MLRNPLFCSFASFLIALLTPFSDGPDHSRDLKRFKRCSLMISFISLLEFIDDVYYAKSKKRIREPKTFF